MPHVTPANVSVGTSTHNTLLKYLPSDVGNLIIKECNQILMTRGHRLRIDMGLQLLHIILFFKSDQSIHD